MTGIIAYIVLSFLVLRFCVTLFNFISHPKLGRYGHHYSDKVSILIPVRNEAHQILNLLNSIAQQDYENYEVLLLDDHSEDQTFKICEDFVKDKSKFSIFKGEKLPKNWLGKNYACYQLAEKATGKYLLFLDADETLNEDLINNSLFRMKLHKLSLLSLFTTQKMNSFGEKSTVPLMHFILLNLLPLVLVRISSWNTFSAASGQMMLFDALDYKKHQWHLQVASDIVEDIEIAKRIKANTLKVETLLANNMLHCRMYNSYNAALNGFSKNILAGFNNQIFGLLIYLFLVIIGPIYLIIIFPFEFMLLPISLILMSRLMISYLSDQNPVYNILLHPIQMVNLVVISLISIYRKITKTNYWKGRKI